ncbi:MAG: hypothetical protein OEW86_05395 [Nitrosopumilus sp.]|nr:hypothetical protein [Nitrosopumilus sp.]
MDDLLDKIYDIESKITNFCKDLDQPLNHLEFDVDKCQKECSSLAFEIPSFGGTKTQLFSTVKAIDEFISKVEQILSEIRRNLKKQGIEKLEDIKTSDYIISKRKKFVTAREEIEKASMNIENNHEDVLNHLRTAIDLSIKEKFKFKKIPSMMRFLEDAKKYDFPLPSYNLIYSIFSEGNSRLHAGEINTEFEASESIRIVANFVEGLQMLQITKKQIDDFMSKSKTAKK